MGKNKKSYSKEGLASLAEKRKKIDREMKRVSIPCSHQNAKGKLKVEAINNGTVVECKLCKSVFDIAKIDARELNNAVKIVHNAINQIKTLTDDPEREEEIIETLGNLDYSLGEIPELYERMYGKVGKKKKKDHNRDDSFGYYGIQGMTMNGRNRNRNY